MAANQSLVLLTGATGFIGFRTLVETLKAGYRVRASVRSNEGVQKVRNAASIKPYLDQLEFVLVEDILKDDAYFEAVKGVDYVIHLASPTPRADMAQTQESYQEVNHITSTNILFFLTYLYVL